MYRATFLFVHLVTATFLPLEILGQTVLRFYDSDTGCVIQPDVKLTSGVGESSLSVGVDGRAVVTNSGDYQITITSPAYEPMSAAFSVNDIRQQFSFQLDPLNRMSELNAERVIALHRPDATIFLGIISGDDTGRPLEGVRVVAQPSGVETSTDNRGFFTLAIPLQNDAEWANSSAKLVVEKEGYQTEQRLNLELAPYSDLTMRIAMLRGNGSRIINENGRRIDPNPRPYELPPVTKAKNDLVINNAIQATNATIRIPRNIRVMLSSGTVDYVSFHTYCKRSLNDEWISSWGSLASGSGIESLKAGAIANRSYAAWYVRNPAGSTYDICATTSCQVYDADTAANVDVAVDATIGYVVTSNGVISRSEYSAENNSTGFSCGDGYTQPTGSCIYDPACSGETRFGHGRGMCQWGTARWATGYKMAGRSSGDSSPNGYPKKDWLWMVNHYYPTLTLLKAQPLIIGDDIKAVSSVSSRSCAGTNCSILSSKSSGTTGTIIDGPTWNSASDGYTWWHVQWSDGSSGWSVENYLERVVPIPGAPTAITATAISGGQINLNWTDTNSYESGFELQRAYSATGPWLALKVLGVDGASYSDTNALAGNRYFYRVRAFNVSGNSAFSPVGSATTPILSPIANRTVVEGTLITFTNVPLGTNYEQELTDFESFEIETSNGTILFRNPTNSVTTRTNISTSPDYSSVTDLFPAGSGLGSRALFVSCNFTNSPAAWLRLTTVSASSLANPVIPLTKKIRFNVFSDKSIKLGLGVRETTTAAGTVLGADGGTTGAIEWIGVTNKNGNTPMPSRIIPAGVWTTVTFDLPLEPAVSFSSGNGVLATASGLGVLEHLAIVPNAGNGIYKMFFDNFSIAAPLSYSLGAGSPAGASINATTGVFTWTPSEAQGPGSNSVSVIVKDNDTPIATNTFTVVITETNAAPVLAAIQNRTVHAGSLVTITNTATDADIPTNMLVFSLVSSFPSGSTIDGGSGVFTWQTSDVHAGTTSNVIVRVTDNGSPAQSHSRMFSISVVAEPSIRDAERNQSAVSFSWNAVSGKHYLVQFKDDLAAAEWTDLTVVTPTSSTASVVDQTGTSQRFYRVLVLD